MKTTAVISSRRRRRACWRARLRAVMRLSWLSLLLPLAACTEDVSYGYFNVSVSLDPVSIEDELRRQIAFCTLFVTQDGANLDFVNISACKVGQVPQDWGPGAFIQYTSRRVGQRVGFRLELRRDDLNRTLVGVGEAGPLTVEAEKTLPVAIVARAATQQMGNDGGTPLNPPPDGGSRADGAAGLGDAAVDDAGRD